MYVCMYVCVDNSVVNEQLQVIDVFMIALFFISLILGAGYFARKIFGKVRLTADLRSFYYCM